VQQLSRHPEVNQESPTAFEPNNQILATAIEGTDPFLHELGGHSGGVERAREARIENLDVLEAPPSEGRLEMRTDCFDLR
jgi:hypothetical protein